MNWVSTIISKVEPTVATFADVEKRWEKPGDDWPRHWAEAALDLAASDLESRDLLIFLFCDERALLRLCHRSKAGGIPPNWNRTLGEILARGADIQVGDHRLIAAAQARTIQSVVEATRCSATRAHIGIVAGERMGHDEYVACGEKCSMKCGLARDLISILVPPELPAIALGAQPCPGPGTNQRRSLCLGPRARMTQDLSALVLVTRWGAKPPRGPQEQPLEKGEIATLWLDLLEDGCGDIYPDAAICLTALDGDFESARDSAVEFVKSQKLWPMTEHGRCTVDVRWHVVLSDGSIPMGLTGTCMGAAVSLGLCKLMDRYRRDSPTPASA